MHAKRSMKMFLGRGAEEKVYGTQPVAIKFFKNN